MTKTPPKPTILILKEAGFTQTKIAKWFGVTPQAISWKIHYVPKSKKPKMKWKLSRRREGPIQIGRSPKKLPPQHVLEHMRRERGMSPEEIYRMFN